LQGSFGYSETLYFRDAPPPPGVKQKIL
jgi:hypothetical protein